jgi:sporulation integral membrane protein YtvI
LKNRLKRLAIFAAAALCCWLAFSYLMPFIIAWCAALIIEPASKYLKKKYKIRRGFTATLGTVTIFGGFGAVIFLIIWRGILWLAEIIKALPQKLSGIPQLLNAAEERLYGFIIAAPPEFQDFLINAADKINDGLTALPARLYERLMGFLGSAFSSAPKIILFIIASAIGTFFLSAGFDEARAFIKRQLPEDINNKLEGASREAAAALKRWAGSELTLVGATFIQLTLLFIILRVKNPVFAAIAVSLIDALPVLGTGTILIPWALTEAVSRHMNRAVILIAAYLSIAAVRSFLEPKLLGEGRGPHPAASLLAIWLGFRLGGVWGMVLFPIGLMIIKRLHDSGYIRLWR